MYRTANTNGPLLLATRSPGKLRELRPLFEDAGFDVVDLTEAGIYPGAEEESLERYYTFEENALAKAHYFLARSGRPTIADDSGLEVMALHGAPGVRSRRWSGRDDLEGRDLDEANNAALLAALNGISDRRARYVCAAAYADWERGFAVRGATSGRIVDAPTGTNGFGYDPYFFSDELGTTFGEASRTEKESISHRGRAFRALCAELRASKGAWRDRS
jgi:XTP/dITP diphosphohydrolase